MKKRNCSLDFSARSYMRKKITSHEANEGKWGVMRGNDCADFWLEFNVLRKEREQVKVSVNFERKEAL